jgi:hypothetical protein
MKKQRKSILLLSVIVAFLGLGLFFPGLIGAGDLEPSSPPGSTMHTLEDIYNKVANIGASPVEKTGQSTSYATGDDGDFEKGITWPDPRFTDNFDGTVTDNLTGLIWLKNANCFGTRNWVTALSDCNGLADGACGLTDGSVVGDWCMPNVKELQSLIDYGSINPALPNGPFTGVQLTIYWSSTTYAGDTLRAWNMYMYYGLLNYNSKDDLYYVWPVRGGN